MQFFITVWLKFFFIFTPFFALSMFLSMTNGYEPRHQHKLALQATAATAGICLALLFFGQAIFTIFGITIEAFRVGAGILLFLTGLGLTRAAPSPVHPARDDDIAVVPLAMPIITGPGTIGTLLVIGAEMDTPLLKATGCLALLLAILCVGTILMLAGAIERRIGRRGLNILSKLTGLVLTVLASQMVLTGTRDFFMHR